MQSNAVQTEQHGTCSLLGIPSEVDHKACPPSCVNTCPPLPVCRSHGETDVLAYCVTFDCRYVASTTAGVLPVVVTRYSSSKLSDTPCLLWTAAIARSSFAQVVASKSDGSLGLAAGQMHVRLQLRVLYVDRSCTHTLQRFNGQLLGWTS